MTIGIGIGIGIVVGVIALASTILEYINYQIFRDTKIKIITDPVNNKKPHHSSKFSKRWTRYFIEDNNILQLLFDTYYRNLNFNNIDVKDILLIVYEYTGDITPEVTNIVIKKLEEKGVIFNKPLQDIDKTIEDIKNTGLNGTIDTFHVNGRTKLMPVYKPLVSNIMLQIVYGYTYMNFRRCKFEITDTPENIRYYYKCKDATKPTVVIFPGIGIGPILYKKFINKINGSVMIVDIPNVNVCHHYFTDKVFVDIIYHRTIEQLRRHDIKSVIIFGHSFGTLNSTNFIHNNLKTHDVNIEKIFLADPICFFSGYARLYASVYRYLQNPQRTVSNRIIYDTVLGDIGNQYMFYRQLKPYLGTYYFSVEDSDSVEESNDFAEIQKKTIVMAAQRDSYINYPELWSHLAKFFPHITRENYFGYHGDFILNENVFTQGALYINNK